MKFKNYYINEAKKGIKTDYKFIDTEQLMTHSPEYKKMQKMSKKDLINKLGYYLMKHQKRDSITKSRIEIAKRKLTTREMADRLYNIIYSNAIMK